MTNDMDNAPQTSPESSMQHPVSSIKYPESRIQYPAFLTLVKETLALSNLIIDYKFRTDLHWRKDEKKSHIRDSW